MSKPYMCGGNKVYMPQNGCSDCEKLENRIAELEEWVENPLTASEIEEATPIECYAPEGDDSRVCYGQVCYAKTNCIVDDHILQ